MAINFPDAPTNGQKHTVAGLPTYTYDGEKWTTLGVDVGSSDAVRYNTPQVLTETQQRQARVNVYAAPMDALAYSGMQVNGSMEVSQELGGVARTTNGYICDGWRCGLNGTMAYSALVDGAGGGIFPLFPNYRLLVAITTAQVSLGAGDYTQVQQFIEGWRIARLCWGTAGAQPITVGFWTAHARTGTYSVVIRNSDDTRSYATTYTHNAANIAQYNVVTIPGDTAGTWLAGFSIGLKVAFSFGCGATYIAPSANTWFAGNYIAAPGQINAVAATSDAFRLTGVVVLPGNEAPSATRSPYIMRPYGDELQTCKRYWQRPFNGDFVIVVNAYSSNQRCDAIYLLPVELRAAPSVALLNINYNNSSALVANASNTKLIGFYHQSITAGLSYTGAIVNADARL